MEKVIFPTPKILIVDDEVRMCESLELLLRPQNFDIFTAHSGEEALELLSKGPFDIALVDIVMPNMNGHELMDHIKIQYPDTFVIIITGNATLDSALGALKRGAYDFLRKPFEYDELLKTVQNALSQRRLKRENDLINGQLALSERRYRYLVENSPDIIYTLDDQSRFTFISQSIQRLLGFDHSQLIGKHYSSIILDDDQEKARWAFNERRTGNRATTGVELRLKTSDKNKPDRHFEEKYLTMELKATGMYDKRVTEKNKAFIGTHGVARDISKRVQLETQLRQSQRMEALGTLGGGIAHNFNNLLMGIHGNTSLMLMKTDPSHPHYKKLKNIERCIQSGAELTKQLLGFARGGKYEVKPTDLNDLLEKSSEMFGRTRKDIRIKRVYQKGIWAVEVDQAQIEQVLLNLYLNAAYAMPGGGEFLLETENVILDEEFLEAYKLMPGKYVKISITDTGAGMDEEIQQRIFEPFFTTKENSRGTGLGLASAYGIIENHKGIIEVQSKKNQGTTFNIYLPVSQKRITREPELEEDLLRGSETILLVDDDEMIINVGKEMLDMLGYKTLLARSGPEAIKIFEANKDKIGLVILDVIMPGMGGGETCDALKALEPDIKVLLSSGYSLDGQAADILNRGCNGFIQKPFNLMYLSQKLRTILDKK